MFAAQRSTLHSQRAGGWLPMREWLMANEEMANCQLLTADCWQPMPEWLMVDGECSMFAAQRSTLNVQLSTLNPSQATG